jgi:hypothetical protein
MIDQAQRETLKVKGMTMEDTILTGEEHDQLLRERYERTFEPKVTGYLIGKPLYDAGLIPSDVTRFRIDVDVNEIPTVTYCRKANEALLNAILEQKSLLAFQEWTPKEAFATLTCKPGDVVVLRVNERAKHADMAQMRDALKEVFPNNRVLVLRHDTDLSVVSQQSQEPDLRTMVTAELKAQLPCRHLTRAADNLFRCVDCGTLLD